MYFFFLPVVLNFFDVYFSFSICDLAGAERQKKAQNMGGRLKESQNINMSHLVLNRCFKIIRYDYENFVLHFMKVLQ